MKRIDHIAEIAELSESEGVFTTAQAARMGIPRDALHDAAKAGRVERIMRGAYRLIGSGSRETDELAAAWKLTDASRFTHERAQPGAWDGIAIGGATAASILGIGDFFLSPYRIFALKRINSRSKAVRFGVRRIERDDVTFEYDAPVTRPERTVFDLILDHEDCSLVAGALRDAVSGAFRFDFDRLRELLDAKFGRHKGGCILESLMKSADTDASAR